MFILSFSYMGVATYKTSNGVPFKQGDTLFVRGAPSWDSQKWSSIDGVYEVVEVLGAEARQRLGSLGYVVTGGATAKWGPGSINIPMQPNMNLGYSSGGVSVISSSGGFVKDAKVVFVNGGTSSDWWIHASGSPDAPPPPPPDAHPPSPNPDPPPRLPFCGVPEVPRDNGNDLDTGTGTFNIDRFIARANFKLGTDAQANNRGAARFIADATKAAKVAKLNKAQTKKLLDAVNKAIAEARAKVKNKPLPKPKGRK